MKYLKHKILRIRQRAKLEHQRFHFASFLYRRKKVSSDKIVSNFLFSFSSGKQKRKINDSWIVIGTYVVSLIVWWCFPGRCFGVQLILFVHPAFCSIFRWTSAYIFGNNKTWFRSTQNNLHNYIFNDFFSLRFQVISFAASFNRCKIVVDSNSFYDNGYCFH